MQGCDSAENVSVVSAGSELNHVLSIESLTKVPAMLRIEVSRSRSPSKLDHYSPLPPVRINSRERANLSDKGSNNMPTKALKRSQIKTEVGISQ